MFFKDEYEFLSNFYPCSVMGFDYVEYPSVEHAYQAAKTRDYAEQEAIRLCSTPGKAKRMGRTVTMREDWERTRVATMRFLLMQKFNWRDNPELCKKLLAIEGEIVEDNNWGDTFWGRCNGAGWNMLGRLLMEIRDLLAEEVAQAPPDVIRY